MVALYIDLNLIDWAQRADGSKLIELSGPLISFSCVDPENTAGCGGAGLFPTIFRKRPLAKIGGK